MTATHDLDYLGAGRRATKHQASMVESCACCAGGMLMHAQQHEFDVLDSLYVQSEKANAANVQQYLDVFLHQCADQAVNRPLEFLFATLRDNKDVPASVATWLLIRLSKTEREAVNPTTPTAALTSSLYPTASPVPPHAARCRV